MRGKFKLVGLTKTTDNWVVATCEPLNREETFTIRIPSHVDAHSLWSYCSGDWSDKKVVILEYSELDSEGFPIDPVWINLELAA